MPATRIRDVYSMQKGESRPQELLPLFGMTGIHHISGLFV